MLFNFQNVHTPELRIYFKFGVAHLPVTNYQIESQWTFCKPWNISKKQDKNDNLAWLCRFKFNSPLNHLIKNLNFHLL